VGPNLRLIVLLGMAVLVALMWVFSFVTKRFEHVAAGVAALELREFDALTVVTLGTGGTFENHRRSGPSLAVAVDQQVLLIDAGRGVAAALRAAAIPADQPRDLLISSLQSENVLGLADLWLSGWLARREAPLRIHGPVGTASLVAQLESAHAAGAAAAARSWALPEAGGVLQVVELEGGERLALGDFQVDVTSLDGGPLAALAYRIEVRGSVLATASAGWAPQALSEAARDADLLLVGAVYSASLEAAASAGAERIEVLQAEAAQHLRLETVGELARSAGVRALVLTRLRPPPVFAFQYERIVKQSFPGPVIVASDGEEIIPYAR
jgi:ribonuclease BN (tRNA processing enzyme)